MAGRQGVQGKHPAQRKPPCTKPAPLHETAARVMLARLRAQAGALPSFRARYLNDPVAFFHDILGIDLWDRQAEIPLGLLERARVAVRSGHKVGKTTVAAGTALWWEATRPEGRVIITAPTSRQVKAIVWRELKRLHRRAGAAIGGDIHDDPMTGLKWPDGREIIGFSTNEAERMGGFSGPDMLFIVDEASGVDEGIYEAIEGNRAGGASLLMLGNPTQVAGTFYEAFTSKAGGYRTIHISSEESPNVKAGRIVVPGLATAEWLREKREDWGEDSPIYQVRVLGEFPSQAQNSVIPLSLVSQAVQRWKAGHATRAADEARVLLAAPGADKALILSIGVDVAYYGDDETVLTARRGRRVLAIRAIRSQDTVQVAHAVLDMARELRTSPAERPRVKVDVIGVGAGVYDQLRRAKEVVAVAVNVAEASLDDDTYFNLRSQLWFGIRDWLKAGGEIPDDSKLQGELVAATYEPDSRGRYKVVAKDKMREKLRRSPDRADSLGLCIYQGPVNPPVYTMDQLQRAAAMASGF